MGKGGLNLLPPKNSIRLIALTSHYPHCDLGSVMPKTAPEKALPLIDHLYPRAIGRRGVGALE
jgi:hypothetical protein